MSVPIATISDVKAIAGIIASAGAGVSKYTVLPLTHALAGTVMLIEGL